MKHLRMVAAATLLALAVTASMAQAPQRPSHRMRVRQQMEQLVQQLALDPQIEERFCSTYMQYQADMEAIFKQHFGPKPQHPAGRKGEPPTPPTFTEEEVEQQILKRFAVSSAILEVRKLYYTKFRAFMSPSQIRKMYDLEKRNAERINSEHMRRRPDSPSGRRDGSLR